MSPSPPPRRPGARAPPPASPSSPTPGNDFTLYGNIRHPAQAPIRAAIHEPPTFAGRLLWHALRQTQIDIDPEPNVRLATHEDRFADAQLLAVVSTPLAEALRRCNTDSHNLYAESMIKRLGSEVTSNAGSWANGAAVVRMLISERLGAEHASTVHIADGSGMSRDNRVTVSTLAAWLEHIADDPALFQPFVASLATPGEGTLTSRFRNAELENSIHAKSGYLTGVYALSGYAIDPVTSKRLVFAMIVNEGARSSGNARNFLDEFVEDIDDYLTTLRPARANAQGG